MKKESFPKRLICLLSEIQGGTQAVFFPVGSLGLEVPYNAYLLEGLKKKGRRGFELVIRHNHVSVGALVTVDRYEVKGETITLRIVANRRVRVLYTTSVGDHTLLGICGEFEEFPITRNIFRSKAFQEKLDVCFTYLVGIVQRMEGEKSNEQKVFPARKKFSEKNIAEVIDHAAKYLNAFVGDSAVFESLAEILCEPSVAKRLDNLSVVAEYVFRGLERVSDVSGEEAAKTSGDVSKTGEAIEAVQNEDDDESGRALVSSYLKGRTRPGPRFAKRARTVKKYPKGKFEELDYKTQTTYIQEVRSFFDEYIVGQERAKQHVIKILVKVRHGLANSEQPFIGGFFCGPTGAGKSEIVRVLAKFLFDDANGLTLIPCANFKEQHELASLKGAPHGFIGYNDQPMLAQMNLDRAHFMRLLELQHHNRISNLNRRQKDAHIQLQKSTGTKDHELARGALNQVNKEMQEFFESIGYTPGKYLSIVLWDEIEKAHQSMCEFQLEILNKGTLPLMNGATTSFRNSIQFWTSNIHGSEIAKGLSEVSQFGFTAPLNDPDPHTKLYHETRDAVMKYFSFNPAFLGRIGKENIIVFQALKPGDHRMILDKIYFQEFAELLRKAHGISVLFTEGLRELVLAESDEPVNRSLGARALRHVLERLVEDPIVNLVDKGGEEGLVKGDIAIIDEKNGEVVISRKIG